MKGREEKEMKEKKRKGWRGKVGVRKGRSN